MLTRFRDLPNLLRFLHKLASGQEFGFSFNVADRCPIGCQCYWRAQARVQEMTDDDVVAFFHKMFRRGYLISVLVGGEPYVRPRLLERLAPIMPTTWVVTSGTTPLIRLPRTTHFVSVDGKDAATHDAVRKSPGLFHRIIKNLTAARATNDFPVFIHAVLNARNHHEIGDILAFWQKNRLADGVIFSTLTPINSSVPIDLDLRLSDSQLYWTVEELYRQKKRFGDFLVNTPEMIDLYRPEVMTNQRPETCGTARYVPSFDASGKRMAKCILSDLADCRRCGCVVSAIFKTVMHFPPSLESLRGLSRLRTRT